MTDELKACPFCGGGGAGYIDDVQYPDTPHERVWYAVTCGKCDANGAWDLGKSGAAEKWNTRAVEDALRARIAELEAQLTPIPFSERTPDRYGTFMFYSRAGWWSSAWYSDITQEIILREYTHWLPLPPAPEDNA